MTPRSSCALMSAVRWAAVLLLGFLPAACATAHMQLPKDFLELDGRADFQAITADDARVRINQFSNHDDGSLAFWVGALEHEFTQQRGYELVNKGQVEAQGGMGSWFECAANVRGERIGYLVAIWVIEGDIMVVEFAARAEVFAARVEAVRAALKTVRT